MRLQHRLAVALAFSSLLAASAACGGSSERETPPTLSSGDPPTEIVAAPAPEPTVASIPATTAVPLVSSAARTGDEKLAPELLGISGWINSEPFTLESQRGKVVLIDFWTYTCINCIRTLPYLRAWHDKYSDAGLVIVGVHTPEFEFEKKRENVLEAVSNFRIRYPVAQDNGYGTWGPTTTCSGPLSTL